MYADDLDFICEKDEIPETTTKKSKNVLSTSNLIVNESKTEIHFYSNVKPDVKKLVNLLDYTAEVNKRKQIADFALYKYRKICKNQFISTKLKIAIYNVYVKSTLM